MLQQANHKLKNICHFCHPRTGCLRNIPIVKTTANLIFYKEEMLDKDLQKRRVKVEEILEKYFVEVLGLKQNGEYFLSFQFYSQERTKPLGVCGFVHRADIPRYIADHVYDVLSRGSMLKISVSYASNVLHSLAYKMKKTAERIVIPKRMSPEMFERKRQANLKLVQLSRQLMYRSFG